MAPFPIQPKFGKRIARARKRAKLSQMELAEKAGIGNAYLCQLEHGDGSPSVELAARLADLLGTTLARLFA